MNLNIRIQLNRNFRSEVYYGSDGIAANYEKNTQNLLIKENALNVA